MTTEVAIPTTAGLIRRELDLAEQKLRESLEHYLAAGAMLIEAKHSIPHGGWLPWLERYVGIGQREAQRYMQLAEHRSEIESANPSRMSDLSLNAALSQISKPKRPALVALPGLGSADGTATERPPGEACDPPHGEPCAWSERQQRQRDQALRLLRDSVRLIEQSERLSADGIGQALRDAATRVTDAVAVVDELASSFEVITGNGPMSDSALRSRSGPRR